MNSSNNSDELVLLLKKSLATIKKLRETPAQPTESIAVVGMSCRFPGGSDTPEKFWEFLKSGQDGITEVPSERFDVGQYYDTAPDAPGKMYLKEGGFLKENISEFDSKFFGISPKEVQDLDPQQRLLLELSWESLERACMAPSQLKGSRTGVFIGMIGSEYELIPRNPKAITPYTLTGVLTNLASGRISHILGFNGPAITIDTACSSSLVSLHLACESLKNKETDLALVGGVNLMLIPLPFIMLCRVRALAKDGRCKSFDASADGYGRGEGAGVIVLKHASRMLKKTMIIS